MTMRAVHAATGVMHCELAVRSDSANKGIITKLAAKFFRNY